MKDILSVDNMRKSDAAAIDSGVPGRELMMRAARGVFEAVQWKEPVAIVCGSGNNAGDGYALALCLNEAGISCTVICVYERFSGDGRYYYDKCAAGIDIRMFSDIRDECPRKTGKADEGSDHYATVVDCMLGTGFRGEVRDDIAEVIGWINESGAYVVSVDINSGLNGDTGMASVCVHSDLTVSVGSYKPGHFLNMAKDVMKEKVNVDIGITPVDPPMHLIEETDIDKVIAKRKNYSNKGTYGYTALIGGSTRYSGAIRLAYLANAAMRSGAGVVKTALPGSIVHDVACHILESTLFPLSYNNIGLCSDEDNAYDTEVAYNPSEIDELISNVRTVAFGMGIGTGDGAAAILRHLLENFPGNLIVDADGLTLLSRIDPKSQHICPRNLILTPHIKEFSRLTGMEMSQILEDPVRIAKDYAASTGTVVLLKGPSTIVTDGDNVYITDRGCAGMATAGSGDVLSGILAAVVSQSDTTASATPDSVKENIDICLATAAAAYINGAAGERAQEEVGAVGMIASDTIRSLKSCGVLLAK